MTSIQTDTNINEIAAQTGGLNVVVLAGGGGGALLADGLARVLPPGKLTVIANTGDDFEHLGLIICPDLDTVMYRLAGLSNPETGWGRAGESWRTLDEVARLGGPDWFRLGDLDLAMHLVRGHLLAQGYSLSEVSQHLCQRLGLQTAVWPMCDQPARTLIETDEGVMDFQTWFVARRWEPAVRAVKLPEDARASARVTATLEAADLVIVSPSNPFVSIDPILNVYPIREMIEDLPELVVAVSPIVAGRAVKGPTAKMMSEWGMPVTAAAVADYYGDLIDLYICDERDGEQEEMGGLLVRKTDTLMGDRDGRCRLARDILMFAMELMN